MNNSNKLNLKAVFAIALILLASNYSIAQMRSSITQWEYTWTFDKEYECGQFINGDWWVVGPVTIISVSPETRRALATEVNDFGNNTWGDSGLQNDSTVRNGSMVVMAPDNAQGYDSRGINFNPSLTIQFPYLLEANRSIISSISNDTVPQQVLFHEMLWENEKKSIAVMKTAAVLTCLAEAPPADAFRPTYIGASKKLFRLTDVHWDHLLNLAPTAAMPSWSQFERYLERPWLDHTNGFWEGQVIWPTHLNQPSYGRENARIISTASLMLHTNVPNSTKEKLLIRLLQIGIDLKGIADLGGNWNQGGGHTSGRKWPIIFAYLMFEDDYFIDLPATAIFHEDAQTYYGKGWAGQAALWQMVIHHGVREPYMQLSPDQWGDFDNGWGQISENYRQCCTIGSWVGQALANLLMEGKSTWDHNAFFDNVEDWMRQEDIYAENRGISRSSWEGSTYPYYDNFITEMWLEYRSQVPPQDDGTNNNMWNAYGFWQPNDIISNITTQTVEEGKVVDTEITTILKDSYTDITLSSENLPSFCSFTDNGNGTGDLNISPSSGDAGDYLVSIIANSESFTENRKAFSIEVKNNTAIHNMPLQPALHVYPNPVSGGRLTIELANSDIGINAVLIVYDLMGRIIVQRENIFEDNSTNTMEHINVSQMKKGAYVIAIMNENWICQEKVFIR